MLVVIQWLNLRVCNKRWPSCVLLIAISLIIGGCWDRRELQERQFVLAAAIDKADEGVGPEAGPNTARVETFVQPHGKKLYRLSLQILQLTPSRGGGTAPRGGTSSYVISNTGESLFEMIRDMLGQVSQGLWFEHVQAIIISEDAVKQGGLQPIIDFFRRNSEIRSLTRVLITPGEARAILEYKPPSGEPSGIFIARSLQLYKRDPHILGWHSDVWDVAQSLDNKNRVIVSRVELTDDILKIGGMALFKEGKFIGYADDYATKGRKFLTGIIKSAIITAECPDHPGQMIVFELFRHDTRLKPHVDGDRIYYTLDITMRGNVGELQCRLKHPRLGPKEMNHFKQAIAEEVKRNALYAFHTYQDLKVDGGNFGQKLKAHEPLVWEKVKDRWNDEIFPTVSLDISVNVVVENIGAHE